MQFLKWIFGKGKKTELTGVATQEPLTVDTGAKIVEDPRHEARERAARVIRWFETVAGDSGGVVHNVYNGSEEPSMHRRFYRFSKGELQIAEDRSGVDVVSNYWNLPANYFPNSIDELLPLPAYHSSIPQLNDRREQVWEFLNQHREMLTKLATVTQPPYQFMKVRQEYVPVIKLFTDLSWVDLGYRGPLITLSDVGDHRLDMTISRIPDSLKVYTAAELFPEGLVEFMEESVGMFPEDMTTDVVIGYYEIRTLLGLESKFVDHFELTQQSIDQGLKGVIFQCIEQDDREGLWKVCVTHHIVKAHDYNKENVDKLFELIKLMRIHAIRGH